MKSGKLSDEDTIIRISPYQHMFGLVKKARDYKKVAGLDRTSGVEPTVVKPQEPVVKLQQKPVAEPQDPGIVLHQDSVAKPKEPVTKD
eukprot:scaffold2116_cov140-Chaetoceros_neogracile.AAC.17